MHSAAFGAENHVFLYWHKLNIFSCTIWFLHLHKSLFRTNCIRCVELWCTLQLHCTESAVSVELHLRHKQTNGRTCLSVNLFVCLLVSQMEIDTKAHSLNQSCSTAPENRPVRRRGERTDLAKRLFPVAVRRQHLGVVASHLRQLLLQFRQLPVAVLLLGRLLLLRFDASPSLRFLCRSFHLVDVRLQLSDLVALSRNLSSQLRCDYIIGSVYQLLWSLSLAGELSLTYVWSRRNRWPLGG